MGRSYGDSSWSKFQQNWSGKKSPTSNIQEMVLMETSLPFFPVAQLFASQRRWVARAWTAMLGSTNSGNAAISRAETSSHSMNVAYDFNLRLQSCRKTIKKYYITWHGWHGSVLDRHTCCELIWSIHTAPQVLDCFDVSEMVQQTDFQKMDSAWREDPSSNIIQ